MRLKLMAAATLMLLSSIGFSNNNAAHRLHGDDAKRGE